MSVVEVTSFGNFSPPVTSNLRLSCWQKWVEPKRTRCGCREEERREQMSWTSLQMALGETRGERSAQEGVSRPLGREEFRECQDGSTARRHR